MMPCGRHFEQRLCRGDVAAPADVFLDARGRDAALVVQDAQVLLGEEGDVRVVRDDRLGDGVAEHQPLDRPSLQHVLFDELGHVLRGELLIEDTRRDTRP